MRPREKEQVMKRKDGGTEERKKGKKRKKKTKGKIGHFAFPAIFSCSCFGRGKILTMLISHWPQTSGLVR